MARTRHRPPPITWRRWRPPAASTSTAGSTRACSPGWRSGSLRASRRGPAGTFGRAGPCAGGRRGPAAAFYLATSPDLFGPICRRWRGRDRDADVARGPGEADRPRPRLGDPDQRRGRRVFDERQVYRIDHYLGKEIGPEPAGAALRQLAVRAGLEPGAHRPRADHGGRDRWRRGPDLRPRRRPARHGPEPHPPASVPSRDGAADHHGGRRGARREAQSAAVLARHRRRRAPEDRARAVSRRLRRGGRGAVLRRGGWAPQPDRDLCRDQGRGRELALGGHPVLPADRQAPAFARVRDRDPVPQGAALDLPARRGRDRAQPAGHPPPARRRHPAHADGQGPRPWWHATAPGAARHPLRRRVQGALPGRVRAPAHGRGPRQPHLVHAARRGRGRGGVGRADSRRLGRATRRPSPTSPGAGARRPRSP